MSEETAPQLAPSTEATEHLTPREAAQESAIGVKAYESWVGQRDEFDAKARDIAEEIIRTNNRSPELEEQLKEFALEAYLASAALGNDRVNGTAVLENHGAALHDAAVAEAILDNVSLNLPEQPQTQATTVEK